MAQFAPGGSLLTVGGRDAGTEQFGDHGCPRAGGWSATAASARRWPGSWPVRRFESGLGSFRLVLTRPVNGSAHGCVRLTVPHRVAIQDAEIPAAERLRDSRRDPGLILDDLRPVSLHQRPHLRLACPGRRPRCCRLACSHAPATHRAGTTWTAGHSDFVSRSRLIHSLLWSMADGRSENPCHACLFASSC